MKFVNLPKFALAMTIIICLTVLMAIHAVPSEAGLPFITGVFGVGFGNGIALKQGDPVSPMIGTANAPDVSAT